MTRALTILTAVIALAVSAAPASAGTSKARTPKPSAVSMGHSGFDHAGIDGLFEADPLAVNTFGGNDTLRASAAPPRPPGAVTPSRGETIGNDWVKAPPKAPPSGASGFAKVIDHDGLFLGFKDGTSNTMGVRV